MASATTAPLTKDNNMLKSYQLDCETQTMAGAAINRLKVSNVS